MFLKRKLLYIPRTKALIINYLIWGYGGKIKNKSIKKPVHKQVKLVIRGRDNEYYSAGTPPASYSFQQPIKAIKKRLLSWCCQQYN